MKSLVILVLAVMLVACANNDSDKLREENAQLKAQLEAVTAERDAFKAQIEAIRKALDMPLPSMSPPSSSPPATIAPVPDTANPPNPEPSATPEAAPASPANEPPPTEPAPPAPSAPEGPSPPADGSTGSAETTPPPPPGPEAPSETPPGVTVSPLYQYASDVLKAAKDYQAETKTQPPLECSLGFEAGPHKVERSQAVKRCQVLVDGGEFRVRVEGIDGTVTTAP